MEEKIIISRKKIKKIAGSVRSKTNEKKILKIDDLSEKIKNINIYFIEKSFSDIKKTVKGDLFYIAKNNSHQEN